MNAVAGEELLFFQSRHPNKARYPRGRTGFVAILAVLTVCLIMLGACSYTVQIPRPFLATSGLDAYGAYLAACAARCTPNSRAIRRRDQPRRTTTRIA